MPRRIDTHSTNATKKAKSTTASKTHNAKARVNSSKHGKQAHTATTTNKNLSQSNQAHATKGTTKATKPANQIPTTKPHSLHLSKSQYLRGVQCHKRLWLYKYKRELLDEPTPSQLARFQAGNEVGELALELFKCKEKIAFSEGALKMSQTQTPKNTQTQNTQASNAQTYKLILQRQKEYKRVKGTGSARDKPAEPSTIGEEKLLNQAGETLFKCYSCENGGESSDTPNQDKRIIARTYDLRFSSSGVNGGTARAYPQWQVKNNQCPIKINDGTSGANVVIWLTCKDKPEFAKRRIHLHSGNCPQHTLGCILLGYTDNKDGTISNSAKCVSDFSFYTFLNPKTA